MQHKIVFAESGKPCPFGTSLHGVEPVAQPYVWRLDGHTVSDNGTHRVTVSRHHPKFGRVKRTFHPRVFGLTVEVEITWYQAAKSKIHKGWHETYVGIYLGFLALIGLAFFENFHMAPAIVEFVTAGMLGGSGH